MRAGDLNQRIDILAPTETAMASGGVATEWSVLSTVWAGVMEGLSREFVASGGVLTQQRAAFLLRWRADIEAAGATLRVGWRGTLWEVVGLTGTRRTGELRLQCQSIGTYP